MSGGLLPVDRSDASSLVPGTGENELDSFRRGKPEGEASSTTSGKRVARTPCQKKRDEILQMIRTGRIADRVPPSCDPDGSYSAQQCVMPVTPKPCYCTDRDNKEVLLRGTWGLPCECPRERYEASLLKDLARFMPRCSETGVYSPKQCLDLTGECWCVDPKGNRLTQPTLEPIDCEKYRRPNYTD